MAAKKTARKLRQGKKMSSVKPLDIVITKTTDKGSTNLMS
jgi:hypothetical protein